MSADARKHAPQDRECERAFNEAVRRAASAGFEADALETKNGELGLVVLTFRDGKAAAAGGKPRGGKPRGGEPSGGEWDAVMEIARDHCLVLQAAAGTAVLMPPKLQRAVHLRDLVLCRERRLEALPDAAAADAAPEAPEAPGPG